MGALLSIPLLAVPSVGTVCTSSPFPYTLLRRETDAAWPDMGNRRLVLRRCYLQRRLQFLWEVRQ
jgi:hypothetical protein